MTTENQWMTTLQQQELRERCIEYVLTHYDRINGAKDAIEAAAEIEHWIRTGQQRQAKEGGE